jgi:hypothetical protein
MTENSKEERCIFSPTIQQQFTVLKMRINGVQLAQTDLIQAIDTIIMQFAKENVELRGKLQDKA